MAFSDWNVFEKPQGSPVGLFQSEENIFFSSEGLWALTMRRQASTPVEVKGAIGGQQYSNGLSKDKLLGHYSRSMKVVWMVSMGSCGGCGHSLNMSENAKTGSHLSSLFSSKVRAHAQWPHNTDVRFASHPAACNVSSKAGWSLVINEMGLHMLKRDHTNLHYKTIGI